MAETLSHLTFGDDDSNVPGVPVDGSEGAGGAADAVAEAEPDSGVAAGSTPPGDDPPADAVQLAAALLGGEAVFASPAVPGSAAAGGAAAAAGRDYGAVSDFSIANGNPNGVWSYQAGGTALGTPETGPNGFDYWWNGGSVPNSASIGENTSGSTNAPFGNTVVVRPDHLNMDPEGRSEERR